MIAIIFLITSVSVVRQFLTFSYFNRYVNICRMMNFGERLAMAREGEKYTQQLMAEQLGVSLRTYQRYEAGDTEPCFDTLVCIADILGLSTDWLLGRLPLTSAGEWKKGLRGHPTAQQNR